MTTQTLAALRTPALTGHNWETAAAFCPVCGCSKDGDIAEPNRRTEACQSAACRCHDENAVDALPFRCRCGRAQFATDAERRAAQPDGWHKCATCGTFSTDHVWYGTWNDPEDCINPRCFDCDIRFGSHR
jgi:hypothetical protein